MKLYDDDDYNEGRGSGSNITYIYMALIMSTIILGVTALVFWVNRSNNRSDGSGYAAAVAQREARMAEESSTPAVNNTENAISSSKVTSDELDIWTLPDTGRESSSSKSSNNGTVTNQTTGEVVVDGSTSSGTNDNTTTAEELVSGKTSTYDMTEKESIKDSESEEDSEEDEEEEDRIQVVHSDGTKEWIDIDEDLSKNSYDFANLKYQTPVMKYYVDGKIASWFGVSITASQGDVDFSKLKKAGCDFCMIKVGARGYSSGIIVMDENYETNLEAAEDAGLDIGVYFCSQAVTKSEAREEAEVLLDAIEKYDVNYPVVFMMDDVEDDMARIDALDISERTDIARTFMKEIADAGYTPMLYGDLEWLLTMLDLEKLDSYDVWYAQDGDEPDYPYVFGMWQYDSDGTIKGISEDTAMSISFVDYSKK